jgi:hypothetical protein
MPKNDGKPWTREDVKALREQARDRNVSTDKIAKNLGPRADGDLPRAAWATA